MRGRPFALPPVPPGSALPAGVAEAMKQALAKVRAGDLQGASALLARGLGAAPVAAPAPASAPRAGSARHFAGADIEDAVNLRETALRPDTPPHTRAQPQGEGAAQGTGRLARVAFAHQGADHSYHLYRPVVSAGEPGAARPLVLMLHGCTQDAQDFARGTRMNEAAQGAGALVLYPTQSQAANANGCWNWFRPQDQHQGSGEPALLLAMVRHAMASHAVDPERIYVAGLSAGGAMAALLARAYPQVFAAAGVHSGLVPGAASSMLGALSAMKSGAKGWQPGTAAAPGTAVPLIVFHGDADTTVHPCNGEQLLQGAAAAAGAHGWRQAESGHSADGQRYTRTRIRDGAAAQAVLAEHWLLHGAGHAWSGGDARASHASARGVNASQEMLRFFLEHPRHADAGRAA